MSPSAKPSCPTYELSSAAEPRWPSTRERGHHAARARALTRATTSGPAAQPDASGHLPPVRAGPRGVSRAEPPASPSRASTTPRRRHSPTRHLSPVDFKHQFAQQANAARYPTEHARRSGALRQGRALLARVERRRRPLDGAFLVLATGLLSSPNLPAFEHRALRRAGVPSQDRPIAKSSSRHPERGRSARRETARICQRPFWRSRWRISASTSGDRERRYVSGSNRSTSTGKASAW
jgi:hypothetical protein